MMPLKQFSAPLATDFVNACCFFLILLESKDLHVSSIITTNKHALSADCQEHIYTFFYWRPTHHTSVITPGRAAFSQSFIGQSPFIGHLLGSDY